MSNSKIRTQRRKTEIVALSQNKRFWRIYDRARRRAEKEGWTALDEV